jgi:hypothetical protein
MNLKTSETNNEDYCAHIEEMEVSFQESEKVQQIKQQQM